MYRRIDTHFLFADFYDHWKLSAAIVAEGGTNRTLCRSEAATKQLGKLEAREGIEPSIKVLQTFALPLGDRAVLPGQASAKAGLPSNRDHSIASRAPFQHFSPGVHLFCATLAFPLK